MSPDTFSEEKKIGEEKKVFYKVSPQTKHRFSKKNFPQCVLRLPSIWMVTYVGYTFFFSTFFFSSCFNTLLDQCRYRASDFCLTEFQSALSALFSAMGTEKQEDGATQDALVHIKDVSFPTKEGLQAFVKTVIGFGNIKKDLQRNLVNLSGNYFFVFTLSLPRSKKNKKI